MLNVWSAARKFRCLFSLCVGCVTFTRWVLLRASALTRSPTPCEDSFLPSFFGGDTSSCVFSTQVPKRMCSQSPRTLAHVLHRRPPPPRYSTPLLHSLLSPPPLSPLRACLTFHNCIITRSVSSRRKWAQHRKISQRTLGAGALARPILIVDPGGMSSSSGRLDSPQHVGQTPAAAAESN